MSQEVYAQPIGIVKEKAQRLQLPLFTDRLKNIIINGLKSFFHTKTDRFHYETDQKETELMIIDKYALNLESVENTPIVAVSRGVFQPVERTVDLLKGANLGTGARQKMDVISCPITMGCYSTEGLEAEHLANYVFGLFLMFRDVFRQKGLHDIHRPVIGEEAIVQSDSKVEISIVPVSIQTYITESWVLTPYANELGDILDPPR